MSYFPNALATSEQLLIAVNNKRFSLTDDVAIDALEINVTSTAGAPDEGIIGSGTEQIYYTSKTSLKFILDNINKRGYDGTTPAAHLKTVEGGEVWMGPCAAYHNILKDEIVAIETAIGLGGGLYITTTASSATPTPAIASKRNLFTVTALAADAELQNPTGTKTNGDTLLVRIKDDGTARALTYDTEYRGIGIELPATTVLGKTLYLGFIYNSADSKWDCLALGQEG